MSLFYIKILKKTEEKIVVVKNNQFDENEKVLNGWRFITLGLGRKLQLFL